MHVSVTWTFQPITMKMQSVRLPTAVSICASFCLNPFSGLEAIKLARFPRPLMHDLDL